MAKPEKAWVAFVHGSFVFVYKVFHISVQHSHGDCKRSFFTVACCFSVCLLKYFYS